MLSTISTPVLLLLAGAIGILLGLLLSMLFSRESKSEIETEIPEKYKKEGYAEAARILYSPATKRTITQLDGDFYSDFQSLTPEQKKRVLRLTDVWGQWSGHTKTLVSYTTVIPTQTAPLEATYTPPFAETGSVPFPPLPQEKEFGLGQPGSRGLSDLEELGIKIPEEVTPIPAVISFTPTKKIPEKKPPTIVEQINSILDDIVAGTPDQTRGIHLEDNGHEGVTVLVGMERFNGVDAVPYPEVQQLIHKAVARWESSVDK